MKHAYMLRCCLLCLAAAGLAAGLAEAWAAAADAPPPAAPAPAADQPTETRSLVDFIKAGKTVGHAIILLSFVGVALVIDSALRITPKKLVPPLLVRQAVSLAREARLAEIVRLGRASDSLLGRVLGKVLAQRPLSLASAREALQEEGSKEITRLQHRVGYIGFIAAVAPMLGLLGTVTGMIYSFNVLGTAKGAADPDELAVGVAEALVTTCEGLIVAIPLMFFHMYFRGRVTRIGQDAAAVCDSVMRGLAAVVEARTTGRPAQFDLQEAVQAQGGDEAEIAAPDESYEIVEETAEDFNPDDLFNKDKPQPR
ncbi:MAG: MotA/TolQ/ExbB proton channel family protein [Planctomycetes bacterium]|nr:MotA/TolQ/ExbB proton channel family protein [Planctomycetota bacterium]